jgi:hypothetical protein
MAATFIPYAHTLKLLSTGGLVLNTDTFYAALVKDTYSPDTAHTTWTSGNLPYTEEVASGDGYTAGGFLLGDFTVTNALVSLVDNIESATMTKDFQFLIIYKLGSGGGITNPLLGYVDFGTTISSVSQELLIVQSGAGLFSLTQNTY